MSTNATPATRSPRSSPSGRSRPRRRHCADAAPGLTAGHAAGITGEFGGSISAEHGIGILKRHYLKMSRTAEEIETMRTLKRALDPKNILNPGRIFTV